MKHQGSEHDVDATQQGASIEERLAALEQSFDRVVSDYEARIVEQKEEIRRLRAEQPTPEEPSEPANSGSTGRGERILLGRSTSRRSLLKVGGMTAAATVAAVATDLAVHPPVAHASGVAWTTGAVSADTATVVAPSSSSYPSDVMLQVQLGTGTAAATSPIKAAITAYDTTGDNMGVYGSSSTGYGLYGVTNTGVGATGAGLSGTASSSGTGVVGSSGSGIGVQGTSGGYGGTFSGGIAPIVLTPGSGQGAPTSGTHVTGEIFVDSSGSIFAYGASGFHPLSGLVLLPAPIRIFDARPGQSAPLPNPKGLLAGSSTTTIQVTGTSVNNLKVPAGAKAVIGNLTVTGTQGPGALILYPQGASQPLTSNINYVGGWTIANFAIVGLSASGAMNLYVLGAGTYALFDVAGYIM